jgi:hypothetical protein
VGQTSAVRAEGGEAEDAEHAAELESMLLPASLPDDEGNANTTLAETNLPSAIAAETEV